MSLLIFVTIFGLFGQGWCQNKPTLLQVNVVSYLFTCCTISIMDIFLKIFRHGDRLPLYIPDIFPNDPNMFRDSNSTGSGELTKVREFFYTEP